MVRTVLSIALMISPAVVRAQTIPQFQQLDEDSVLVARVQTLCRPSIRKGRGAMLAVERAASTAIAAGVKDSLVPAACARALLAIDRELSVPGYGMPLGTSWIEGVFPLLYERLRTTTLTDDRANELLAAVALLFTERTRVAASHDRRVVSVSPEPSASLLLSAVHNARFSGPIARACVSLMHALGDFAALRRCATVALSQGSDSTWHLLRLASADFREGFNASGMKAFEASVRAARSDSDRDEVLWHMEPRFVGSGFLKSLRGRSSEDERALWRGLPPDSLLAFVRTRYGMKGLAGMKSDEERLGHYFGSLAYAGGTFWDCGFFLEVQAAGGARRLPCNAILPPPPGTELIPVGARWYRLWEPRTGQLFSIVAALGRSDWRKGEADGLSPTLTMSRRAAGSGAWRDSTVQILPPNGSGKSTLGWLLRLPETDWVEEWQAFLIAGEQRRGGASGVFRPRDAGSSVSMSDLVVGSPSDGLSLTIGAEEIPFSATGNLDRRAPVTLYTQFRGLPPDDDLALDIAVYDGRGTIADPLLRVSMSLRARGTINELVRELDLSRLDSGPVRLEVAVSRRGGPPLASRLIALELR